MAEDVLEILDEAEDTLSILDEEVQSGVCADGNVQLNGVDIGTIGSGATKSFDVHDAQGVDRGSWDGSAWIVGGSGDNYFLDTVPIDRAYMLYKFKSDYSGPAVIAERSSDGAYVDVEFDGRIIHGLSPTSSGNDLATWGGGDDIFFRAIYDQMGSGDLFEQTDRANQMQFSVAGDIYYDERFDKNGSNAITYAYCNRAYYTYNRNPSPNGGEVLMVHNTLGLRGILYFGNNYFFQMAQGPWDSIGGIEYWKNDIGYVTLTDQISHADHLINRNQGYGYALDLMQARNIVSSATLGKFGRNLSNQYNQNMEGKFYGLLDSSDSLDVYRETINKALNSVYKIW